MGFTFSHPALILPFRYLPKKYFSFTGLVVGSIVPDFEYFFRHSNTSHFSHTFLGVFWFDLPVGILLSLLYHNIIRNALIRNSPVFIKKRLLEYQLFEWNKQLKKTWYVVSLSIIIGAFTHLFWDAFTSLGGYFVEMYPAFFMKEIDLFGNSVYVCHILKYFSSIVGLATIMYSFYIEPFHTNYPELKGDRYYWIIVGVILVTVFYFRTLVGLSDKASKPIIKTTISSGMIAVCIASWVYKSRNKIKMKKLLQKGNN